MTRTERVQHAVQVSSAEAVCWRAGGVVVVVEEIKGARGPGRCSLVGSYQCQEFLAGLGVVPEDPQHSAGHSFALEFLYASHHHTHVPAKNKQKNPDAQSSCFSGGDVSARIKTIAVMSKCVLQCRSMSQ